MTRNGVEVPKASADAARIRKELTVSPMTFDQAFPPRFKVYAETPGTFVVPRFWAVPADPAHPAPLRTPVQDVRPPGKAVDLPFVGALKADLGQPEAVRAVLGSLRSVGGAVLALATGQGKTASAIYVASQIGTKTVVVVGKEFLATQWEERIAMHIPTARVTRVQGKTFDTSGDIVIAMLQTLARRKHATDAFEEFGLLIVDE